MNRMQAIQKLVEYKANGIIFRYQKGHYGFATAGSGVYQDVIGSLTAKRTGIIGAGRVMTEIEVREVESVFQIVAIHGKITHYQATRVLVPQTRHYPGFHCCFVPAGESARKETGGALIPGPFASAYGISGCISTDGGTKTEIEREKAAGQVVTANIGDLLVIEGIPFRVEEDHNRNIKLVNV